MFFFPALPFFLLTSWVGRTREPQERTATLLFPLGNVWFNVSFFCSSPSTQLLQPWVWKWLTSRKDICKSIKSIPKGMQSPQCFICPCRDLAGSFPLPCTSYFAGHFSLMHCFWNLDYFLPFLTWPKAMCWKSREQNTTTVGRNSCKSAVLDTKVPRSVMNLDWHLGPLTSMWRPFKSLPWLNLLDIQSKLQYQIIQHHCSLWSSVYFQWLLLRATIPPQCSFWWKCPLGEPHPSDCPLLPHTMKQHCRCEMFEEHFCLF